MNELEEKGFLNCLEKDAEQKLFEIKDQKKKLGHFITNLLITSKRGLTFQSISKNVSNTFKNFFSKDFIFKVIDELFQLGLIYEMGKQTYMYHEYTAMQGFGNDQD